ncbi:MAG TPA: CvpA family protein [Planctomycetaceae bacterium]|jgi:membrane protein required for colicin V production|nr:CvpA family protein [Planctomycetaceae bacterium]
MWYDLLTLGILMYAMFRGATKGIVWQLATIAALLMCFFFSGSLSHVIAPFIRVEEPLNKWIAMLVLYLVFSFVCFGAARVLHEAIESMRIEALDRHMGALLGLVKGGMFSLFLTFFLVTLSNSARESIIRSESGYVAAVVIDRLDPVIPGDLHALLEPYLRRLDAPEIEREHREEEYARRNGDDRDDPFTSDDRRDDGRDGRLDGDRRNLDARRDDDRPFDENRRGGDRRLSGDGPNALDRRDDGARRDDGVRRGVLPDRPRDGRDSAFDDAALDAPGRRDSAPRPALDGRSDVADDFRDSPRGDRRREIGRDDDRLGSRTDLADNDLGAPSREESDWLSSLPATIDQGLKILARKAWRATKPEHRGELSRRLSSTSVPDLIRKTLRDWQNGRPADGPAGDSRDERAALEQQIVRSLERLGGGSDRRMAVEDIEATLGGIPDDVALNVLRGWRTDLRDQKSDRDPREIDGSSLVRRVRRELSVAGISVRSLDSATQDRLRGGGELR